MRHSSGSLQPKSTNTPTETTAVPSTAGKPTASKGSHEPCNKPTSPILARWHSFCIHSRGYEQNGNFHYMSFQ